MPYTPVETATGEPCGTFDNSLPHFFFPSALTAHSSLFTPTYRVPSGPMHGDDGHMPPVRSRQPKCPSVLRQYKYPSSAVKYTPPSPSKAGDEMILPPVVYSQRFRPSAPKE